MMANSLHPWVPRVLDHCNLIAQTILLLILRTRKCTISIQVLNSDLTFSSIIGGKLGSKNGEFAFPWGVTCDSTGNVYVAGSANNRIQVFTAGGKFQRKFGRRGKGEGELNFPVGVAVDSRGMVFISESKNHRISVFTTEGQFVKSFGQCGTKPGEFDHPRWLAVDDYDLLCVCDRDNSRVQIF